MRPVIRACIVLSIFLAIPIVPFLILGEQFEADISRWVRSEDESAVQARFLVVVGTLASDIFLPIPASAVITYAGGVMGFWSASLAAWIGTTAGACLGFGFSRWLGQRFARRFAEAEDLDRIEKVSQRFGPLALLVTRPLPILAEACVLVMGTTTLTWRRFLAPVVLSNLAIAAIYAAAGMGFEEQKPLMMAAVVSGTIPLLLALQIRRRLSQSGLGHDADDLG